MKRSLKTPLFLALALATFAVAVGSAGAQHDPESDDHLLPPAFARADGSWGNLQLVGNLRVSGAADDVVADHTVFKNYAYVAKWGAPDCAGPETGGQTSPDGGVWVVDISNPAAPKEVGFIAARQDTLVGEGTQALTVTTPAFNGDLLAMNHEACGKNGRGGFSLWDISDPLKPKKLSENFGDLTIDGDRTIPRFVNTYHSVFVWDAGAKAYLVATDNEEFEDVDIYDVTDPRKPKLINELDMNDENVAQPEIGLTDSFLHDMVVKQINGRWILLLSYWDGGYTLVDVSNPAAAAYLSDTEFAAVDPELFAQTGVRLTPEGNAHQAEFNLDNRFVVGTDEDFDPFRLQLTIDNDGSPLSFRGGLGSNTDPDDAIGLNGTTVFVGRACPGDPAVPPAPNVGSTQIAVIERGVCLFTEKLAIVEAAGGYEAAIIMNREGADGCTGVFGPAVEAGIPVLFIGRESGFAMFDKMFDLAACLDATPQQSGIPIGTIGDPLLDVEAVFDGWGYIHLFGLNTSSWTLTELDTFAIPEAMDEDFAEGFGPLSVHEVATDKSNPLRFYSSYYAGGMRAFRIDCTGAGGGPPCTIVETGGFIDPDTDGDGPDAGGNEFWGVETWQQDGQTYVSGSDMDYGLFILRVAP
jgi:LVIVD repeat